MTRIALSEHDGSPIYQQIVNQVKLLVSSGQLKPDEELPSIRSLAERLLVNPNTVARAYRELETAGVVSKKRATGCYVSADASAIDTTERLSLLADKADGLLSQASQLGIGLDDLLDFLRIRNSHLEVSLT